MSKRTGRKLLVLVLAWFISGCFGLPAASANGGTEVWVNNVWLNSASPYWKNGNATASADDWNAYFNAAASTLTLKNAIVNTPSDTTVDAATQALVYVDGDITVVLEGDCVLSYAGAYGIKIAGIYASGTLTVTGGGSLSMQITATANQNVMGFTGTNALTVEGGALDLLLTSSFATAAFVSGNTILFSGGSAVAVCDGLFARVFNVSGGTLRITGGAVKGIARSTGQGNAIAVLATSAYLEGGQAFLIATASEIAYGFLVGEFTLVVTGGDFATSGTTNAVYPLTGGNLLLTGRSIYGSESRTGSGLRLILPGRSTMQTVPLSDLSAYRYLWFTADAEIPRTGDGSMPWLWAGIALLTLGLGGWIAKRAARLSRRTGC